MRATGNDVIRSLAVLLVLNSHLDPFYANKMISGGGALANALFFFLSGVGISVSSARSATPDVLKILKDSFWRIPKVYVPAWLVGILLTIFHIYIFDSVEDFIQAVVWPTRYWFLYALVFFYPIVVLVVQSLTRVVLMAGLLFIVYVVWYVCALDLHRLSVEDYYFRWITYLGLMLFGATLTYWRKLTRVPSIALLVLSIAAFVAVKVGIPRLQLWSFQFLLSALLFPFAFGAYWTLRDTKLPPFFAQVASFIGRHSLEVYVIQVPVIHWYANEHLPGVVGISLVAMTTFTLAPILRRLCRWIVSR